MDNLQVQARALGDPTRHAIYRYLVDAGLSIDIAELTDYFELNHNAIRQHLAKLVSAGLVIERVAASSGPGRPRLLYEADPTADSRWGVIGPYERLSLLLTEIIRTGDTPLEVGRRAGKAFKEEFRSEDALGDIVEVMARQGFEPEVQEAKNRTEVILATCPFSSTALADPDTVCSLHLGIAEGLAEGTPVVVDELIAKDPRRARCRLRLHVEH